MGGWPVVRSTWGVAVVGGEPLGPWPQAARPVARVKVVARSTLRVLAERIMKILTLIGPDWFPRPGT